MKKRVEGKKSGCGKTVCSCNTLFFIFKHNYLQLNVPLSEKSTVFFSICTFSQTTSLSSTPKSSYARTNRGSLPLLNIPRTTGGLLSPRDPFAQVAATSSARCLAFLTLKRAHTRPYTILRQAVKSPSNAGWLRSSTVGFAEPFRSVCRNVSGKLPSHPFAALTCASRLRRGAVG